MPLNAPQIRRLVPPRQALTVALLLTIPLVTASSVAYLIAGGAITLGFLLGAVAGVPSATAQTHVAVKAAAGILCIVAAVGGSLAASPLSAGVFVVFLAVAQGPLTQRASGIGMFAPVIAAIFSTVATGVDPLSVGLGTALGFAFIHLLAHLLKLPRTPSAVKESTAWSHAVAFAVLAGPAVFITQTMDLGHGFWLVLTIAAVLRPVPTEARLVAGKRLSGTVAGVVLAVVIGTFLPTAVVVVIVVVFSILMGAWAICKDVEKQALFGTPVVLLLASGGTFVDDVELGAERLVLTAVAAGVSAVAAALLGRQEKRTAERQSQDGVSA